MICCSLPCTGFAWSEDDRTVLTVSADKTTRFVPIRASASRWFSLLLFLVHLIAVVLLVLYLRGSDWHLPPQFAEFFGANLPRHLAAQRRAAAGLKD